MIHPGGSGSFPVEVEVEVEVDVEAGAAARDPPSSSSSESETSPNRVALMTGVLGTGMAPLALAEEYAPLAAAVAAFPRSNGFPICSMYASIS